MSEEGHADARGTVVVRGVRKVAMGGEVKRRQVETPNYRYVMNMELMDFTGSTYVSMFNEDAEKLLGMKAVELKALNETNKEEYDNVFKRVLFKEYVFRLRVKVGDEGAAQR